MKSPHLRSIGTRRRYLLFPLLYELAHYPSLSYCLREYTTTIPYIYVRILALHSCTWVSNFRFGWVAGGGFTCLKSGWLVGEILQGKVERRTGNSYYGLDFSVYSVRSELSYPCILIHWRSKKVLLWDDEIESLIHHFTSPVDIPH